MTVAVEDTAVEDSVTTVVETPNTAESNVGRGCCWI